MSVPGENIDPPTVTRRLSPRARTALESDAARRGQDGDMDEPTVVMRRPPSTPPDMPVADSASLANAAHIVLQLEASPERTLVRAAAPLLLVVAQLRNSVERADVAALRRQIVEAMDRFQQDAQKAGIEANEIIAGRYVLCATIDETVLTTPWGSRSEWSANSLLNQYHNETWGGEKVFLILERIRGNAEKKIQLLLLIHTCLMLGFEGRYRVLERGRDQLEDLRNDLSRLVRRHIKSATDEPLSRQAKGEQRGRKLNSFIPLWMVGVGAVCLLVIVHGYVQIMLSGTVEATAAKIQSLAGG